MKIRRFFSHFSALLVTVFCYIAGMSRPPWTHAGAHGVGLRTKHYGKILQEGIQIDFMEAISENFMDRGGRPRAVLEKVRQDAQVVLHGVSMSIGGMDPFPEKYFTQLKNLRREIEAAWVSDHLCFGTYGGHYGHDLWPLPYTEEAVEHCAARVREAQDLLGEQILIENVSSYVQYADSIMSEWEFTTAVAEQADCKLLLDVNNVYVSSQNHGFDPYDFLNGIPVERVGQLHLAGHLDKGDFLLDNHGSAVPDSVWELYGYVVKRFGRVPALMEWDEGVPELPVLLAESEKSRAIEEKEMAATEATA